MSVAYYGHIDGVRERGDAGRDRNSRNAKILVKGTGKQLEPNTP